uniref:Uncharacterized protein n=1 Tax=Trichogramma kaykai TaxID=54128 RepID=A0ABD2XNB9_9HYME
MVKKFLQLEIVRYVNVYATSCAPCLHAQSFITNKDTHIFGKLPLVKRQKYSLLKRSSFTFLCKEDIYCNQVNNET